MHYKYPVPNSFRDTVADAFHVLGDESHHGAESLRVTPPGAEAYSADLVYTVRIVGVWNIAFSCTSSRAGARVVVSNAGQKCGALIGRGVEFAVGTGIAVLAGSGIGGDAEASATHLRGLIALRAASLRVAFRSTEAESAYVIHTVRIVVFGNKVTLVRAFAHA